MITSLSPHLDLGGGIIISILQMRKTESQEEGAAQGLLASGAREQDTNPRERPDGGAMTPAGVS